MNESWMSCNGNNQICCQAAWNIELEKGKKKKRTVNARHTKMDPRSDNKCLNENNAKPSHLWHHYWEKNTAQTIKNWYSTSHAWAQAETEERMM